MASKEVGVKKNKKQKLPKRKRDKKQKEPKRKEKKPPRAISLVGSAKLDEHLVGGAFGANLVAHQINCNRASALLVLVQHGLVVFARNILVL